MKKPVIIWQKPEYKKFGRVKVAVFVSPTLILDQKETPEIKNFDHHQWVIPKGVNLFGYKAIMIKELPSRASINGGGLIEQGVYEQYDGWISGFVRKAPSGKECMLISNTQHEYAALIPRTRELNVMATVMEYPFNCIMQPLVDQYKEWKDSEYVALVWTDPKQWNIPAGTDTKEYWTPILCSNRGLGFAPSKRIKNVITPHVGMDYHPMTEQEAWRFVNNELLKA